MRVVSFNVNGLRARLHQLEHVTKTLAPDIIGLQETKVTDAEFPLDDVKALGYDVHYHGQKGHYGVALLSKLPPVEVQKGFPWDDKKAQKRLILGRFKQGDKTLTVINGYFPQGENRAHPEKFPNKERFYADLMRWLGEFATPQDCVLIMGDMNISSTDLDIGIGEDNRKRWLREGKCSFLPEERAWMDKLLGWGLTDAYRARYPETNDRFSWFDYRSKGFEREPKRGLRIDLILATSPLMNKLKDAGIDYETRSMEKPSDHAPVWTDFDL